MAIAPRLFRARVMHKRLFPQENAFTYGIYYLAVPLDDINALNDGWRFGVNRPAIMGFYENDHGPRDGTDLMTWIRRILDTQNMGHIDGHITLVCMPRIFGYVFNPVSFWLCHDKSGALKAILCDVHNTFGESHSYLCVHADGRTIKPHDEMIAQKMFHVSPFLPRDGRYRFRFNIAQNSMAIWIDYDDADDHKKLITSLMGTFVPLNRRNLRAAFWRYPLITVQTIILIHWQAVRLFIKKAVFFKKPRQHDDKITTTITKI